MLVGLSAPGDGCGFMPTPDAVGEACGHAWPIGGALRRSWVPNVLSLSRKLDSDST